MSWVLFFILRLNFQQFWEVGSIIFLSIDEKAEAEKNQLILLSGTLTAGVFASTTVPSLKIWLKKCFGHWRHLLLHDPGRIIGSLYLVCLDLHDGCFDNSGKSPSYWLIGIKWSSWYKGVPCLLAYSKLPKRQPHTNCVYIGQVLDRTVKEVKFARRNLPLL